MCVVCGCSSPAQNVKEPGGTGLVVDAQTGDLHFGAGAAHVAVPGLSESRAIRIEQDVLGANNRVAQQNRAHFRSHGVRALNLVSSPGSGKTTLLCATIRALQQGHPGVELAVIEGDQQTSNDADRIRATGTPAIQINTGKGCHLDAPMVAQAFARLALHSHAHAHGNGHGHGDDGRGYGHGRHQAPQSLLFIENVGNLVCPALWDLGEDAKVVILSVTEGEDKPVKYPDMFAAAEVMVLTKIDLLPHLEFDVQRCMDYARRVNPDIRILQLSAISGEGMQNWMDWLLLHPDRAASAPQSRVQARIAQLEAELQHLKARQD